MKFAYFNPTVMAVDEVPADIFLELKNTVDRAHTRADLDDSENPHISIRGGQQIQLVPNNAGFKTEILKNYIEGSVKSYLNNIMSTNGRSDLDEYEPILVSAWTIKQGEGDYQALHNHEAHVSGNIYLDVPDFDSDSKSSDGNIEFRLPVIRNPAHLIFVDQWRYQPKTSTMVIFPSYVSHTVYPWKGSGNRTILAWDVRLFSTKK